MRQRFAFGVAFVCSIFQSTRVRCATSDLPRRNPVENAITLASHYMEKACGPDGHFAYETVIASGRQDASYNVVRHAGAIYSLAMLQGEPDQASIDAAVRAASYLQKKYIGAGARPDQQVAWSKPLPESSTADLGATGLGLAALTAVKQERPGTVSQEQLQAMGNFLVFMQREDGSFVSKYRRDTGPEEGFESLYYPGEAALGLVDLYEIDHNERWLTAATKALIYLARSRAQLSDVPPDHWAMIASAELLGHSSASMDSQVREHLIHHAVQICHALMKGQQRMPGSPLDGSFDFTGRTSPTATRMEGLLAALEFVPHDSLRSEIKETVDRGIAFLLRTQIKNGVYAGAMPNALIAASPEDLYLRIDFVQHALCAWIRYQRMFLSAAPNREETGSD